MAPKTEKKKIADREYIAADGSITTDETAAVGVRYTHLERKEVVTVDLRTWTPAGQLLIGVFGLKTWIGNLFNQELDRASINDRLETVKGGEWPEREGFGGPRYDAEALATAIMRAKKATDAAPFAARIASEKGYAAMALKVPAVLAHYNELTQKAVTVDNL